MLSNELYSVKGNLKTLPILVFESYLIFEFLKEIKGRVEFSLKRREENVSSLISAQKLDAQHLNFVFKRVCWFGGRKETQMKNYLLFMQCRLQFKCVRNYFLTVERRYL